MKKIKKLFIVSMGLLTLVPGLAFAQSSNAVVGGNYVTNPSTVNPSNQTNSLTGRLNAIGDKAGFVTDQSRASTAIVVGIVIQTVIGLLGLVFIILIIIAGFKWMMANGNEEEVKKALRIIKESIIGLIIILSAWTLWTFIFQKLIGN